MRFHQNPGRERMVLVPETSMGAGIFKVRRPNMTANSILWFVVFFALGGLIALYPVPTLVLVGVGGATAVCVRGFKFLNPLDLQLWQLVVLPALTGYMLLNYGFENLTIHVAGVPVIISYGLMYLALIVAIFTFGTGLRVELKEPASLCLIFLLFLSFIHLMFELPKYGVWALRDSSMVLDGIFLLLGLLWARRGKDLLFLLRWLMVLFVINMFYGLAFPWSAQMQSMSPKSGVFIPVPIVGNYHTTYIFLLAGTLFCIVLAKYVVRWPAWILIAMALAQLFGLALHQDRSMYLGLMIALVVFTVLGEAKKTLLLTSAVAVSLLGIFVLTSVMGVEISGRIGKVDLDFFLAHLRSVSGEAGTPGSTVESRVDWLNQAYDRFLTSPVFGVGFGRPLINYVDPKTGVSVRQPHNSSLSILARLGVIGALGWLLFQFFICLRFWHAFRYRRYASKLAGDLVLWLFVMYLVFMLTMSVEPALEFPSSAIPFYFFVGLALGIIRWQIPTKEEVAATPRAVAAV
ncbi:MAG TPA: O-antigen ligase family protein [Terriglobales bacterium]|nr:O-antigen ligase family protein [Terriglobales bacterium]